MLGWDIVIEELWHKKKYAFGLGCLDLTFYGFSEVHLKSKSGKMIMYHI